MSSAPPTIFSPVRRAAAWRRMAAAQRRPDAPRYVMADMVEDVIERIAFLQVPAGLALVIGDWTGDLGTALRAQDFTVSEARGDFADELPFPDTRFGLIISLGRLDTANDLPGALIHLHRALAPGGLALASFIGAGSLPALRAAMLVADGDRPAPRLHPMVDVRAGGQLLQRANWVNPVVDARSLEVRYRTLARLIGDLRGQGMGNVLARPGPPLSRNQAEAARQAFGEATVERFEILTLSGWRH